MVNYVNVYKKKPKYQTGNVKDDKTTAKTIYEVLASIYDDIRKFITKYLPIEEGFLFRIIF